MKSQFKLIDGEFRIDEAKEVLINLLEFKIQYHNKQNFSSEIRNGETDERSLTRQEDLKRTKQELLDYLKNFAMDDTITIYSEIQINK